MHVGRTKAGRLKPPFRRLQPLDLISSAANVDEATFFAAIAASQQIAEGDRTASDLKALQTIVKHGGNSSFYCHDDEVAGTFSSKTLVPEIGRAQRLNSSN